jgi:hypothetical protein
MDNSTPNQNAPTSPASQTIRQNTPSPTPVNNQTPNTQVANPQAQVVSNQPVETPSKPGRSYKKIVFLVVIPLIVVIAIFALTLIGIGPEQISKPKYLPTYIPAGYSQTAVKYESNQDGSKAYIVTYSSNTGHTFYFDQVTNPPDFSCVDNTATNSSLKDYGSFLPEGSTDGCVHTALPPTGGEIRYYKWLKDGMEFEITDINYGLGDEEVMNFANSLKLQESEPD